MDAVKKSKKSQKLKSSYCYDDDAKLYRFITPPRFVKDNNSYVWDDVEVRISSLKRRGFGLFAKKNLKVNTLIPYGGILLEDISSLTKKVETSSYLVACGENCTGPWRDGNPRLIKNQPKSTWVGMYVNEPNGKNKKEMHNSDLFTWTDKKVIEVPEYPFTVSNNAVFIRVLKPIHMGEEIFVHYFWTEAQQRRRGYISKPPPKELYLIKDEEVIPEQTSIRKHGRGAESEQSIRLLNNSVISTEYRLKKKARKEFLKNHLKFNLSK